MTITFNVILSRQTKALALKHQHGRLLKRIKSHWLTKVSGWFTAFGILMLVVSILRISDILSSIHDPSLYLAMGSPFVLALGLAGTVVGSSSSTRKFFLDGHWPKEDVRVTITAEDAGLTMSSRYGHTFSTWDAALGISSDSHCLYLISRGEHCMPFPKNSFETPQQMDEFVRYVAQRIAQVEANTQGSNLE